MELYDYIIIGSGSAGRTALETLLEQATGESILLVDQESHLPYKRTQVSKNVFAGFGEGAFAVHTSDWYAEQGVELLLGVSVDKISVQDRTLRIGERHIGFSKLLLATGALPVRPFPGLPADRHSELWTKDDALRLKHAAERHRRIAVIGNGVLGVEASWQLRQLDRETTLIGRSSRPMGQYLDEVCSGELNAAISSAGVSVLSDCDVTDIDSSGEELILHTASGSVLSDFVVTTTGAKPNVSLAEQAGIPVGTGILVSEELKTSIDGVWAAGDCTEHPDGTVTGLWHSAQDQGRLAALSMAGVDIKNENPPFRLKCEVFGGLWFSAGPVNSPSGSGFPDPAENWRFGPILWRPRFLNGRIAAMNASAPEGMEKALAKAAQKLLLEGATRETCRVVLSI